MQIQRNQQTNSNSDKIRLIQVTDPHLGTDRDYIQAGINTYESLENVLAGMAFENSKLNMVVATGDISCNAHPESYQLFGSLMAEHKLPFAWLPGNHDDIDTMQRHFDKVPFQSRIDVGNWTLLMLKTCTYNQVQGELSHDELDDLAYYLEAAKGRHVAIFTHHPVTKVGSRWIDKQRIANAGKMAEIVSGFGNVKAVFSGHVHQAFYGQWHGVDVYTSPSTCFQFAKGSKDFSITDENPGYRWIDLFSNGRLQTGLASVELVGQTADQSCVGY